MISPSQPLRPEARPAAGPEPARSATRQAPPPSCELPLTAEGEAYLGRARAILSRTQISDGERQIRLQVVRATLTSTVIRPSDDSPEMRNPAYWILVNDCYVVAPGVLPVEAIEDLWILHGADGVPVPRIRCLKYTALVLIQGIIQHFRTTGHAEGLDAINRLIGHKVVPQELPNGGDDLLWHRHFDAGNLLPGDQVWFDNPFFDRGCELFHERFHQEALRAGKSPEEAQTEASTRAEAVTAGEEGSNAFYLGGGDFILGADSLVRPYRGLPGTRATEDSAPHELVFTPKVFSLPRFREHMIDDNYSVQACLRADPASVSPDSFTVERVRAPIGPEHLLRHHALGASGQAHGSLIAAMASSNLPPAWARTGTLTVPDFAKPYDWSEQERVRLAIDAVMRADADDIWWHLWESGDDDRYVLTATRGAEARNFTIGMLCGDLAEMRLCLCFARRLPLVPGRLPASFHPVREFLLNKDRWRRERTPLHAMQAALCEAAIRHWESVRETEPGASGRAHRFSGEEKARYVAALRMELAELARTRRAAREEVILPCLPAPSGWEGFDLARASAIRASLRSI